jgi:hypothetical protein
MNKVLGKIVLRGSDIGIPRLLVTVYDTNSSAPPLSDGPPSIAGAPPIHGDLESRWDRLGSVLSNSQGTFDLAYSYDSESEAPRRDHDLILVVSPPEESCTPDGTLHARIATCMRRRAGSVESFLIFVDEAQLASASIPIQGGEKNVDDLIKQRRIAAQRQEKLRVESLRMFAEKLDKRRNFERLAESKFEKFLSALSVVPEERRNLRDARYVPRGISVLAANQAVIRSDIQERISQASVAGVIALSDEQLVRFKDAQGHFLTSIPSAEIETLLRPKQHGRGPLLLRRSPPASHCPRIQVKAAAPEGPVDPCVEILEGKELTDDHHHEEPPVTPPEIRNPEVPTKTEDIPLLIGNLVNHMTPPESTAIFKVQGRAGIQQVQEGVSGFTLERGPAEAPALHDFHHLQIAFRHVWQELFDEGVIKKGKRLYTDLVELGIDPNEYLGDLPNTKEVVDFFKYLQSLAQDALKAAAEPSIFVISAFDITPEQWAALEEPDQGELEALAHLVGDIGPAPVAPIPPQPSSDETQTVIDNAEYAGAVVGYDMESVEHNGKLSKQSDALRKAQNIIRYADYKLNSPQKFQQLHRILTDLEQSMREPYRFSIYAAGQGGRSVNFGMVTTYRQKWELQNYQVGELVKTVPLAPKEVRKFTKKVAIRKSRAEKEVENNLQARKTENTETARAETEII